MGMVVVSADVQAQKMIDAIRQLVFGYEPLYERQEISEEQKRINAEKYQQRDKKARAQRYRQAKEREQHRKEVRHQQYLRAKAKRLAMEQNNERAKENLSGLQSS